MSKYKLERIQPLFKYFGIEHTVEVGYVLKQPYSINILEYLTNKGCIIATQNEGIWSIEVTDHNKCIDLLESVREDGLMYHSAHVRK